MMRLGCGLCQHALQGSAVCLAGLGEGGEFVLFRQAPQVSDDSRFVHVFILLLVAAKCQYPSAAKCLDTASKSMVYFIHRTTQRTEDNIMTDRTKEAQAYAAADAAIARADAVTFSKFGAPLTDARIVNQWSADVEAAEACRIAAKFGPEHFRKEYIKHAVFFDALSA